MVVTSQCKGEGFFYLLGCKILFICCSAAEVEECLYNLQLPSNLLSLLGTEGGIHLLAFGDETLQLRFAYKLNNILNKGYFFQFICFLQTV